VPQVINFASLLTFKNQKCQSPRVLSLLGAILVQ